MFKTKNLYLKDIEMESTKQVIGIDVSKDKLAISIYNGSKHTSFEIGNDIKAIDKELIKKLDKGLDIKSEVLFVMEATGVYHLKIASHLATTLDFKVGVVNPLTINRYMQMNLSRCKSDKADSKLIAEYGYQYSKDITLYVPKGEIETQIENILRAIDDFNNQLTVVKNQLHAISFVPNASKKVIKSYMNLIEYIDNQIDSLKKELEDITKDNFKDDIDLLKSIPGVGNTLASIVIGFFGGFKNFNKAKEAISYIGLNPSVYQSGTSVKGKGSISKKGNPYIRKILYVCAWSAMTHNKQCKELYERLKAKGKNGKVAIIAVASKLLRQAFGVLKSGVVYNENYVANINKQK